MTNKLSNPKMEAVWANWGAGAVFDVTVEDVVYDGSYLSKGCKSRAVNLAMPDIQKLVRQANGEFTVTFRVKLDTSASDKRCYAWFGSLRFIAEDILDNATDLVIVTPAPPKTQMIEVTEAEARAVWALSAKIAGDPGKSRGAYASLARKGRDAFNLPDYTALDEYKALDRNSKGSMCFELSGD